MKIEEYLEYLCLDSILQGYVTSNYANTYCNEEYCSLLNDGKININIRKLRARVAELQKKLLQDYELR